MNKAILLILFFSSVQLSLAQQAVVGLPLTNVIYIGTDNPIDIAVEGYKYNQLKITTKGCKLIGDYPKNYIKADSVGTCFLDISLKTGKNLRGYQIRVKNFLIPECSFGALESGYNSRSNILAQNSLRAFIPGFACLEGVSFNVISYKWTFVGNTVFNTCLEKHKGSDIPPKLKEYIRTAHSGDAFIIDEIIAMGPGGYPRQLNPIEIIIDDNNPRSRLNNLLFYYKKDSDAEITFHKFGDTIFCCNTDGSPSTGILRKYSIESGDSILSYELKYEKKRIVWVKEFYKSGKINVEYNFGLSDTLGQAISFYKNGNVKAKGNVVADIANISKKYRSKPTDSDSAMKILDSFLLLNFAPVGNWKGYYPDGKTAFECNLILKGMSVPFENGGSLSDGESEYSIKDALRFPKTNLHPELWSPFKTYNRQGHLISEEPFED